MVTDPCNPQSRKFSIMQSKNLIKLTFHIECRRQPMDKNCMPRTKSQNINKLYAHRHGVKQPRWRLLPKKEPFGGMPIVNGLEPQSMVPSSSYQLREPFIHFLSLMKKKSSSLVCLMFHINFFIHLVQEFYGWKVLVSFKGRIWPPCKCMVLVAIDLF